MAGGETNPLGARALILARWHIASTAPISPRPVKEHKANSRRRCIESRKVSLLVGLAEDDPEQIARTAAFRQGLARLGWVEGRNVRIDFRFAPSSAQLQVLARELIALKPDVTFAVGTGMVAAVQRETSTIPVVFVGASDPIGSGFVSSLARPGGNLTGLMNYEAGIVGKWLSMLKEIAPDLMRAVLIGNPKTAPSTISCTPLRRKLHRSRSKLCRESWRLRSIFNARSNHLRARGTAVCW